MDKSTTTRLQALDGLRGIAILAVIFTHLSFLGVWHQSGSRWLQFIVDNLFGSGDVGVSILFILTGFLMSWLYANPASITQFWSRRFARLLPPYLAMVVSLTIIRSTGSSLPALLQITLVLGSAIIVRFLWETGLRLAVKIPLSKWLVWGWVVIFILTAVWYALVLLKVPPAVFYQLWHPAQKWLVTGLVNATFTLPFGNYIGQLDGVYWSLAAEMFFYLMYPFIYLPILRRLKHPGRVWQKAALFLSVLPFCFGLSLLAKNILGFNILRLELTIYFIVGSIIGFNLDWFKNQLKKLPLMVLHPFNLIPVFALIFIGKSTLPGLLPEFYQSWVKILLIFPIGVLVLMASQGDRYWGKWLTQKWLVFLGKYSYSLYLTHTLVIELVTKALNPTTVAGGVLLLVVSLTSSILLSMCLYWLVENAYFSWRKADRIIVKPKKSLSTNYNLAVAGLVMGTILLLYLGFKPNFAVFTSAYRNRVTPLELLAKGGLAIFLDTEPTQIKFIAEDDNLGMITTHLRAKAVSGKNQGLSYLLMRIKDDRDNLIKETAFKTADIYEDLYHPFGFPIQSGTRGREYTLEYQLDREDLSQRIEIMSTGEQFITVYFPDRNSLLRQPGALVTWLLAKISFPFTSSMFWFLLLFLGPSLLLLLSGVSRKTTGVSGTNR